MTVAYDATSAPGTFSEDTTPLTWTHTPVGTPAGVVILNHGWITAADTVTYGGVAATEMASSPLEESGTGENTVASAWFLGASLPTGAQTVSVGGGNVVLEPSAITFTAAADMVVQDDLTYEADSTNAPSGTLSLGGNECYCGITWRSGENNPGSVSPGSGWTQRMESDIGSQSIGDYTYDTIGTSDVDISGSMTQSNDDLSLIAWAITESGGSSGAAILPGFQNTNIFRHMITR